MTAANYRWHQILARCEYASWIKIFLMLQASVCYRIILAHTAEPCQFIRIIEANLVQNGPLGDNFHNIKCDWSACSWCVGGCQLEVTDIIYIFGEDGVAVSLQSFCMGYLPFGETAKLPMQ